MPTVLGIQTRSTPEFRAGSAFLMVLVAHEANMENARLRQPSDPEYCRALGEAVYTFSILEWNAVWICERIKPGALETLNPKTAGTIAKRLITLAGSLRNTEDTTKLLNAALRFDELVEQRNGLVHGRPGLDRADGLSKLFRAGELWTVEKIRNAADEFSQCAITLNEYFHGFLSDLVQSES